ncbi:MAG: phosphoribosylformylglycinamidine synthase II, partial [Dehalococcoidia bacterium]|nr:phosphoribosylformylglycinamidine synthase II [Dehalococcoidia bacterium]
DERRPAVQVGNPFLEKLLLEACVELAEQHGDWIEGLQDLGAAGLTSSSVEAADRAGTGIDIDVALVPRREQQMTPYEVMLSESQERMLVIPKREHLEDVLALFRRWEINADVIGIVTDDQMVTIRDGDDVVACIPIAIPSDPPQYPPDGVRPTELDRWQSEDLEAVPDVVDPNAALLELLGCPNIASRRSIYRQYDHQVLNNTVVLPGGDAAVLRVKGSTRGIAASTDCNGRFVALEPRVGAAIAVAEAARNVVATGARPAAVTDCLNFGNPEKPEVAYQLEQAILGISDACRTLNTPVVSGNASLYNETPNGQILPTPSIGMLGVIDHVETALRIAPHPGDTLLLVGAAPAQGVETLAGSEYLTTKLGRLAGLPMIDLDHEARVQELVLDAHEAGLLTAAHDCADGGLAITLAEMCLAADSGIDASAIDLAPRLDASLFGEAQSRFVVAVAGDAAASELETRAAAVGVPVTRLGGIGGARMRLGPTDLSLDDLRAAYDGGLDRALRG